MRLILENENAIFFGKFRPHPHRNLLLAAEEGQRLLAENEELAKEARSAFALGSVSDLRKLR